MGNRVFLDELKHGNSRIYWNKTIGMEFKCIYNDNEYIFKILDYRHNRPKTAEVYLFLDNKRQGWIVTNSITQCKLGGIILNMHNFQYDIEEVLDDIEIIDRRYNPITNRKEYKIHCLKCGYDAIRDTVFKNGIIYDHWIAEGAIKVGKRCACCCPSPQIVVPGINDIPTTTPWMIPYFQGGKDEAKLYTYRSTKMIYPKCPDCGRVKDKQISVSNIWADHSIGCICADAKSYPNKFAYALLEQLPVKNIKYEWQPDWLKPYHYDSYFEYNDNKYILEMDGGLGHGNNAYGNGKDIEGLQRDIIKDNLAKKHKIIVIRINCIKSDLNFIKNNILQSELNSILQLSNINWEYCDEFATSNYVKYICELWNDTEHYYSSKDISKMLHISATTVNHYLNKGKAFDWCNYNKKEAVLRAQLARARNIIVSNNGIDVKTYRSMGFLMRNIESDLGIVEPESTIYYYCKHPEKYYKDIYQFRFVNQTTN